MATEMLQITKAFFVNVTNNKINHYRQRIAK